MSLTPAFIEIDRLKEFSVVNENLDNKLLEPTLIAVQDLFLRQILGKDLYNELKTQVDNSSVTSDNQTLLNDYIEPYLINKVIANCMLDITYKLRNKAVMTNNSDNGQVATLTDLSKLMGQYENRAEGYKKLLDEFLCDNGTTYPLYCQKKSSQYNNTTGIYFGNVRPKKGYKYPEKDNC